MKLYCNSCCEELNGKNAVRYSGKYYCSKECLHLRVSAWTYEVRIDEDGNAEWIGIYEQLDSI